MCESIFDNIILVNSCFHHGTARSRLSNAYCLILVILKTVNARVTSTPNRANWCNRKSKFQDGGRLTGSTYIVAYTQDSNEIPKVTPTFSGSSNSVVQA